MKGDYRRYLLACEVRLQEQDLARYREFLAYRDERRKDLVRFVRSGAQSALMRVFGCPDVLDFAAWDTGHNQQGLPA